MKTIVVLVVFALCGSLGIAQDIKGVKVPGEVASISFDNSKNMVAGGRAIFPVLDENVELTDGISGGALRISPKGRIEFPVKGLMNFKAGAVSLWFRPNNVPVSLVLIGPHRGLWSCDAKYLGMDMVRGGFVTFYFNGGGGHCFPGESIKAGAWQHVVHCWEDGKNITYYNGLKLSNKNPKEVQKFPEINRLVFGRRNLFGKPEYTAEAFDGSIDEVRIFDRMLSSREVEALFAQERPVVPFLTNFAALAGKSNLFRAGFYNQTDKAMQKEYVVSIERCDDKTEVCSKKVKVNLPAKKKTYIELEFNIPDNPGSCQMVFRENSKVICSIPVAVMAKERITDSMPVSDSVDMTLIQEIDCTTEFGKDKYRDDGKCIVSSCDAGGFRETTGKKVNSGFAYRFDPITEPGTPYWLEVEYPDNKTRTFSVVISNILENGKINGRAGVNGMGILTGMNHPLTGKMQKKRMLFWPDNENVAVIFLSYINRSKQEAGPAVAKIRLYKNNGLLPRLPDLPEVNKRKIMPWDEDPTMPQVSWFNNSRSSNAKSEYEFWNEKLNRMVRYARFMGWNQWSDLGLSYFGNNNGLIDRSFSAAAGEGCRSCGWRDMFAMTFEREELDFYLGVHPHVYRGAKETILGFLANFIGDENISRDFELEVSRGKDSVRMFDADGKFATGHHSMHQYTAALNPIHPKVRDAFKDIYRYFAQNYNRYKHFRGIDQLNMLQPLHFGHGKNGYGDCNIDLFEKETGIKVPAPKDKTRFAARYKWLKENTWNEWLDWRCQKVADLVRELSEILNEGTEGRKIFYRLQMAEHVFAMRDDLKRGVSPDPYKLFREAGADIRLLQDIPGVIVAPGIRPNSTRIHNRADERSFNFSPELASLDSVMSAPGFILNDHSNLETGIGFTRLSQVKLWGGVDGLNCYSKPHANNIYELENIAWTLAEIDPVSIAHGFWGTPENGAHEEFRKFYAAYTSLPAEKFAKAPGVNDPVMVRWLNNGLGNMYLVNKAYYSSSVLLTFNDDVEFTDNVTGDIYKTNGKTLKVDMKGLQLLALGANDPVRIISVKQIVPALEVEALNKRLKRIGELVNENGGEDVKLLYDKSLSLFNDKKYTASNYTLQHKLIRDLNRK